MIWGWHDLLNISPFPVSRKVKHTWLTVHSTYKWVFAFYSFLLHWIMYNACYLLIWSKHQAKHNVAQISAQFTLRGRHCTPSHADRNPEPTGAVVEILKTAVYPWKLHFPNNRIADRHVHRNVCSGAGAHKNNDYYCCHSKEHARKRFCLGVCFVNSDCVYSLPASVNRLSIIGKVLADQRLDRSLLNMISHLGRGDWAWTEPGNALLPVARLVLLFSRTVFFFPWAVDNLPRAALRMATKRSSLTQIHQTDTSCFSLLCAPNGQAW